VQHQVTEKSDQDPTKGSTAIDDNNNNNNNNNNLIG
jgi:hypothetical protein